MQDLSLHLLDLVQNSIAAEANLIEISIEEDEKKDWLSIVVDDNGKGMDEETIEKAVDPFYTTRTTRKVGLGLPLFRATAQRCGGDLRIQSIVGRGTRIQIELQLKHIDRPPFGRMEDTIVSLILCNAEIDFVYSHKTNYGEFILDTREVRKIIGELPINNTEVIAWIQSYIREGLNEINGGVL
ncbi:MAG: sensor histidine kinase [Clostridiales bacterium]|jgi:hypothetical protein|nr:sensor histidine kinase [Clostridiales bacterium]